MTALPTIICFPVHPTSWPTMAKIANACQQQGRFEPVVLLTDNIADRKRYCDENQLKVLLLNQPTYSDGAAQVPTAQTRLQPSEAKGRHGLSLQGNLYRFVRWGYGLVRAGLVWLEKITCQKVFCLSLYHVFRAMIEVVFLKLYAKRINLLLDQVKPRAVFVYIDNLGGVFAYMARECQRRGIKIIVVSAAFYHPDVPAFRRERRADFTVNSFWGTPWINALIQHRYPGQIYRFKGKDLVFFPAFEVLAMRFLKILPPYPWIRGLNFVDKVCVDDFYQEQMYLTNGVPKERIAVVGHIDVDDVYRSRQAMTREAFFKNYEFDPAKKLIIFALPNFKEHQEVDTWEEHFAEIEFLMAPCLASGCNLLLALHPKMDLKRYAFLETRFRCRINTQRTCDAIAFADIYVNDASSTALWAVICGIPVVNAGFYGYDLGFYAHFASMYNIPERAAWPKAIERITQDQAFYSQQKQLARQDAAKYFWPLDGKNTERYLALLE